jgi:hypothetical protein
MKVQDALSSCCDGIKDFAASACAWIGRTVSQIGSFLAEIAAKIAQFVKPHFERLKTFVMENKESVMLAGAACAVGAAIVAVVNHFCCSATTTPPPAPLPGATP